MRQPGVDEFLEAIQGVGYCERWDDYSPPTDEELMAAYIFLGDSAIGTGQPTNEDQFAETSRES